MIIKQTSEFDKWFKKLQDGQARAKISVRIRRLQESGHLGDWKVIKGGNGVCEMRINYGPGYRIYFSKRGEEIVLLLAGGDKSSQDADIAKAKKITEENP